MPTLGWKPLTAGHGAADQRASVEVHILAQAACSRELAELVETGAAARAGAEVDRNGPERPPTLSPPLTGMGAYMCAPSAWQRGATGAPGDQAAVSR